MVAMCIIIMVLVIIDNSDKRNIVSINRKYVLSMQYLIIIFISTYFGPRFVYEKVIA